MIDGVVGPEFEQVDLISFTPNSKHVAYMAFAQGKWFPVLDGKRQDVQVASYTEDSLQISDDGRHVLFLGADGHQDVYLDGKIVRAQQWATWVQLSPDAKLLVFAAARDGDFFIDANGKTGPILRELAWLGLSPDGKRYMYVGYKGSGMVVGVDGKVSPTWDEVRSPSFSRDSKHFAYLAQSGSRWRPMVDGKPGPELEDPYVYVLAPDPAHVRYVARKGNQWRAVVNGQVRPPATLERRPSSSKGRAGTSRFATGSSPPIPRR